MRTQNSLSVSATDSNPPPPPPPPPPQLIPVFAPDIFTSPIWCWRKVFLSCCYFAFTFWPPRPFSMHPPLLPPPHPTQLFPVFLLFLPMSVAKVVLNVPCAVCSDWYSLRARDALDQLHICLFKCIFRVLMMEYCKQEKSLIRPFLFVIFISAPCV